MLKHTFWGSVALDAAKGATLGLGAGASATLLGVPGVIRSPAHELTIGLATFCAIVYLTPARVLAWVATALPALVALLVVYTPVIEKPARSLVRSDSIATRADAIVLLSVDITSDGHIGGRGVDRLLSAAALSRRLESRVPIVVTTIRASEGDPRSATSTSDQRFLLTLTSASDSVIVTPPVFSTHDEALATKRLAVVHGWRRVAVVTSPSHTRRACRVFERTGLQVTCVPSRSSDVVLDDLAPGDRLEAFRVWLYETAGTLKYRWHGWL